MADISTGRQRGIVPFVDETTGRLPDQYLPQGVIDLQGDLEQAVTDASASATAAKASAESATQSASAAAQSAESASGDASAAKASADGAASSASAAKASETAAASSATAAEDSASAAKVSETAASQSAQTATEQVSSIGDSVERAAASATAAQQSATESASSASNASQSASSASTSASQAGESASQASGFASTASQAATTATGAASNASASASSAQQSASDASASAQAAGTSETNAASSASAAKVSETNAADSATAAQQAVDGFGLEVGTTTTGEPGTDAAVEIQKDGTKYTANFTIPRGDKGEKGDVPSLSRTMVDPESQGWNAIDFNDFTENGVYTFNGPPTNSPKGDTVWITGTLIVVHSLQQIMQLCAYYPSQPRPVGFAFRDGNLNNQPDIAWTQWRQIAFVDDLPDAAALANEAGDIASLSTRVQALEARIKSLETN